MAFFNFNKTEAVTPIIQKEDPKLISSFLKMAAVEMPKPVETSSKDWVLNGKDNSFANELVSLKNESGIQSAIIESISKMIVGKGFMFAKTRAESDALYEELPLEIKAKIQNFTNNINATESIDTIMFQFIKDFKILGYAGVEVIWNADYSAPININYIDGSRLAIGKKDINGNITHFFYCSDWKNTYKQVPIRIPIFNAENAKKNKEGRQIIFIKNESNGLDYYGLPEYYSGINWVKCDSLMATLNLNNIENGFSPSVLFKFFSKPTPEEQDGIVSNMKKSFSGAGQKISFLFWPDKDTAPEVEPLNIENFNESLITLNDMIVQQIITCWRIQPTLCGIQIPGKLGGSNDLGLDYKTFNSFVIQPERKIFEKILTSLFNLNGFPFQMYFEDIQLFDKTELPNLPADGVKSIKEIIIDPVLTAEQKAQMLVILFGLDRKAADKLLSINQTQL